MPLRAPLAVCHFALPLSFLLSHISDVIVGDIASAVWQQCLYLELVGGLLRNPEVLVNMRFFTRRSSGRSFLGSMLDSMGLGLLSCPLHGAEYRENLLSKTDWMEGPELSVERAKQLTIEVVFGVIATLYEAMVNSVVDTAARKMIPFRFNSAGFTERQRELYTLLSVDALWANLVGSLNCLLTNRNNYDRRLNGGSF